MSFLQRYINDVILQYICHQICLNYWEKAPISLHIPQRGKADFAVFAHFGQGSIGSLCCAAGSKDIIDDQDVLAGKIVCSANAESVGHIGPFVIHLPFGLGAGVATPFKDIAPEVQLRLFLSEKSLSHTTCDNLCLIISPSPPSDRVQRDRDNIIHIREDPSQLFTQHKSHIVAKVGFALILYLMNKGDIPTLPRIEEEWSHPMKMGSHPKLFLSGILRPIPIICQWHILHTIFTDIPLILGQQPSAYLTLSRKNQIRQTPQPHINYTISIRQTGLMTFTNYKLQSPLSWSKFFLHARFYTFRKIIKEGKACLLLHPLYRLGICSDGLCLIIFSVLIPECY